MPSSRQNGTWLCSSFPVPTASPPPSASCTPSPGKRTRLSVLHLLILCSVPVNTRNWKSQIGCQETRDLPSTRSHLSSIQFQCLSIDLLFPLLCLSVLPILWVFHRTGLCGVHSETKVFPRSATAKGAPFRIERGDCYVLGTNSVFCIFITFTPNNNPTG